MMARKVQSPGLREAALLAGLFATYEVLRMLGRSSVAEAVERGWWIVQWQASLGLPSEAWAQGLVLPHGDVVAAVNVYYVLIHFPGTALFLVWLWRRHRSQYEFLRNLLVSLTVAGLALHALLPVAPPRLLPASRFVDTMAVVGPTAYGDGATASLANQYAAFPSLHVGWALLVAYGAIRVSSRQARWLLALHPLITTGVVVVSANHYWVDVAAAAALLAAAALAPALAKAVCRRVPGTTCRSVLA